MIDSLHLTLRQAYERFYRSTELKPRTLDEYQTALKHWERLTDNPPVRRITNAHLLTFKNRFLMSHAATTFNKTRRHLLAILKRLGPPMPGNPEGLGIIEHYPFVKSAKESHKTPRIWQPSRINRIYEVADRMTWPQFEGSPCAWWRGLIVYLFNIGMRRNDVLSLEWKDVDFDNWLILHTQEKTGKQIPLPMNAIVIQHLRAIETESRYVFPVKTNDQRPFKISRCQKSLYRNWKKLQRLAGIPADELQTFQQLRSTCATSLYEINPKAGKGMLCHSSQATTDRHYANVDPILRKAADAISQPTAFTGDDSPDDDPDGMIIRFPDVG